MAIIGTAHLHVVPTFDGLTGAVKNAFGSVDAGAAGKAMGQQTGQQFSVGLSAASGAVMGVFSQIAQRAMGAVTSHIDSAVSRVDILHNYPLVMQSLGVAADEADASIQTMSDRLQNLPTRLDSMASTVQGLYAATERYGVSLGTATEAGLALNNMLLAGGGNQQIVNSAMEQFRQMLSKGKPDMQDWKSLLSAAPGQMNQLAHAMLGATATTQDLYYALGGGKDADEHMEGIEFASISVNELLDAIIRLNGEGSEEFSSFSEQAEEATGGIGTAMANMENAITRGIADVVDTIGRENIVGAINDIKGGIREAFGVVSDVAEKAVPYLQSAWGWIKENGVEVAGLAVKIGAVVTVGSKLGAAFEFVTKGKLVGSLAKLAMGFSPVTLAITAAVGVATALAGAFFEAREREERLEKATSGLSDAVSRATGLDDYAETINDIGLNASYARVSVDEMVDSVGRHADSIASIMDSAEAEISTLNTAQQIIDEFAGKTTLSSTEQGKLQWALEQVNEALGTNITLEDIMAGQYEDEEGATHDLREELLSLIEARKAEVRLAALSDSMTEAIAARKDAMAGLAAAEANVQDELNRVFQGYIDLGYSTERAAEETELWMSLHSETLGQLDEAQAVYDSTTDAVDRLAEEMANTSAVADGSATEWQAWASRMSDDIFGARLWERVHKTTGDMAQDLENLGYSADQMADLSESELNALIGCYNSFGELVPEDVDKVIGKMGEYNDTELVEHSAKVSVDSTELVDALKRMGEWNTTSLKGITGTIRAAYNVVSANGNASGGYRLHADGAIATRAVPLDIVGEAGAEAIVPLTNRKYAQPFIDMLSEGIAKRSGSPNVVYNINVDGNALASDARLMGAFEGFMREVARKADM